MKIFCVCVGDKYNVEHVNNLYRMVKKNLSGKFGFFCLTDNKSILNDVSLDWLPLENPNPYPGWWSKINIFQESNQRSMYFDLDVIITGSLDCLVPYANENLSMPENWALSGHGGYQSSVMCWKGGARGITMQFQAERIQPKRPDVANFGYYVEDNGVSHWGDQEYLTYHYKDQITEIEKGLVVSYKYACRGREAPPDSASVVCFHGDPKYDEVNDKWVKEALS